jgi:ribosomal protein S12 methylthiotransferase
VLLTEDLSTEEGMGAAEAGRWTGHAAHQDPEADGTTTVTGVPDGAVAGMLVAAEVVDTEGVDLVATALVPAVHA